MAILDDAVAAVVAAVDALEAVRASEVPVTVTTILDPVRVAVEGVLTSEGWTAPATADGEETTPSPEDVAATADEA